MKSTDAVNIRLDSKTIKDTNHEHTIRTYRGKGHQRSFRCHIHGLGGHSTDFCRSFEAKSAPICLYDSKEGGCTRPNSCSRLHPLSQSSRNKDQSDNPK
jgi:hypothetical protein